MQLEFSCHYLFQIIFQFKIVGLGVAEGDKNTTFFHKMVNAQKRRNYMTRIRVNGIRLSKDLEIKRGIVNAFHSLLSEARDCRPSFSKIVFACFKDIYSKPLGGSFLKGGSVICLVLLKQGQSS